MVKAQYKLEIDTNQEGVLVLDGNTYSIDGDVVQFISDIMEELTRNGSYIGSTQMRLI